MEELGNDLWDALKKETVTEKTGHTPGRYISSEGGGSKRIRIAGGCWEGEEGAVPSAPEVVEEISGEVEGVEPRV